jgi:hypothetical protein
MGLELHGDEVSWHRHLVQSDAADARDLGVEPGVVVTEEADPRANAADEVVETRCLAHVSRSASVPLEFHSRGSVVHEQHVDPGVPTEIVDFVARVVALRVALEVLRMPPRAFESPCLLDQDQARRRSLRRAALSVPA